MPEKIDDVWRVEEAEPLNDEDEKALDKAWDAVRIDASGKDAVPTDDSARLDGETHLDASERD